MIALWIIAACIGIPFLVKAVIVIINIIGTYHLYKDLGIIESKPRKKDKKHEN